MSFFGKLFARKRGGSRVGNYLRRKASEIAPEFFTELPKNLALINPDSTVDGQMLKNQMGGD